MRGGRGFTLTETVVVVAILAATAALLIPLLNETQDDSLARATLSEMGTLRDACVRWKQDLGTYPASLADLAVGPGGTLPEGTVLPAGLSTWNPETHRGWRPPYVSLPAGRILGTSVLDAWGHAYSFTTASPTGPGTIRSAGANGVLETGGDDLVLVLP